MRTVYLNGQYILEDEAKISIFDRGFLFSDSVYEVTAVLYGKLIGWDAHYSRLQRSLQELDMSAPIEKDCLVNVHRELILRNNLSEGLIYMQITRGVADRNFVFSDDLKTTLVLFTQAENFLAKSRLDRKLRVISMSDTRWSRRDIKTTQLLASSIMKTKAKRFGKDDVWMVQDGFVTEGTSNNAFIVLDNKTIVTHNLTNMILHGTTREAILRCSQKLDISFEERPFTIMEAQSASEAFITSATNFATSVVEIDGKQIGNGQIGPITRSLRELYLKESVRSSI